MDFHSLSRKELQALCKKNKIPANLTNLAMADSLANLSTVEGIEEIGNSQCALQVQSPQTCRGSSRRPLKDSAALVDNEPPNNSSVTLTRTRRGTRTRNDHEENDPCENPSGLETLKTPAVRTTSRRAVASSVCKRLDSQVKDKDTPAAPPVYSTRRSARLVPETIVSESGPRKGRGTKAIQISALTDNDFSKQETKADSSVSDCTSPNVSSLTEATLNGDSATSDFNSISSDAENPVLPSVELPEYATEEKPNAVSEEAVVENQVSDNASDGEQKAPAVGNSTPEDSTDLEGEDTTADDQSLLLASATEAKSNDVCEESAMEIQVTSGAVSSEVLVDIKSPKGLPVGYSTLEDSNNLTPNVDLETVVTVSAGASNCEAASEILVDIKSPKALTVDNSIAEDSDNMEDNIHVEVDYETVISVSSEVPSNGAEKTYHIEGGEELVGSVVSGETTKEDAVEALITGDGSFNANANQTEPPVDHAPNFFTHQAVTNVDVASTDQKADTDYLLSEDGLETVVSVSAEASGCGDASNGQVVSEVLSEIKSPKALTVDNSIGEDTDNLKDDIHAEDDSETVISISAEFPSNGAEKNDDIEDEELVVNGNNVVLGETSRADVAQVLTTGDGYNANQITSPVDNAPNSCTHQAVTGKDVSSTDQVLFPAGFDCVAANLEYSPVGKVNQLESIGSHPCANACDELLEGENATQVVESMSGASPSAVTGSIVNQVPRSPSRQSEVTPKSSIKKKATPVPKMVLKVLEEEDKDIVQATEEKEKATPISKMVTSLIDDNKENDALVAEEKEKNNRKVEGNREEALQKESLRKLRKIVKEKIQLQKARPALQSLTDNRLDGN